MLGLELELGCADTREERGRWIYDSSVWIWSAVGGSFSLTLSSNSSGELGFASDDIWGG